MSISTIQCYFIDMMILLSAVWCKGQENKVGFSAESWQSNIEMKVLLNENCSNSDTSFERHLKNAVKPEGHH